MSGLPRRLIHSQSPYGPIGVQAALRAASDPTFTPRPTLLEKEFSLSGRVAVVSGGQRGLGLEMAEALAEAGAAVYCLDLPAKPDESFGLTQNYVSRMKLAKGARLEYASVDVTDQSAVWNAVKDIADKEGRLDVCIAAAGILHGEECLDYDGKDFRNVMNVNTNGAFFTAQAAGRQMTRFGTPGSIILIASMSGSLTNKVSFGYTLARLLVSHFASDLGPSLHCIQFQQVCGATDGPKHGM